MAICPHHWKSPVAVYFNEENNITKHPELAIARSAVRGWYVSLTSLCYQVYVIDLGLAKRYCDANTNRHIPCKHDMQAAIHILDMGVYIGGSLIGGDNQQGGLPICPDNISFAVEYLAENKLRIFVDMQGNFRAITFTRIR
ncbi:hypothetical protein F2Q68_00019602 [Brassica cretica]|uniref:Uncharacterized protein n=1 Tax=Brassica cretica TaxID=69181 RepID=A0A8S9G149_BRACR|nr:hypothetical protein F2Q68_00019602 [Brassica cretica]